MNPISLQSTMTTPRIGAARVGIGGPVGSGKTALVERLIPALLERGIDIAVITNDLVTAEDAERIRRSGLIDPARVSAVEARACPHTVIREDPTLNIEAADELERRFPSVELILLESGGDNLASTFSRDLTDFWMFVIDVAGGDDIPRKRGPGVIRADLLVINKVDLAPHVGVDLGAHASGGAERPGDRPVLLYELPPRRRHRQCRRPARTRGSLQDMTKVAAEERALLDLTFVRRGGRTVIDRRLFAWPFVLTRSFHIDRDRPDRPHRDRPDRQWCGPWWGQPRAAPRAFARYGRLPGQPGRDIGAPGGSGRSGQGER